MSLYKELNGVSIDLSDYADEALPEEQKAGWQRRVLRKIKREKAPRRKRRYAGYAAAIAIALTAVFSTAAVTFADDPMMLRNFIEKGLGLQGFNKQGSSFSEYKTELGITVENKDGKITLEEGMINDGYLLLTYTFTRPETEAVFFNTDIPHPVELWMNGEQVTSLSQLIGGITAEGKRKYTLIAEITLPEIPDLKTITFRAAFNYSEPMENAVYPRWPVDDPWTFEFSIDQEKMERSKTVIPIDKEFNSEDGAYSRFVKLVTTPVSTTIYFEGEGYFKTFKLVDETGEKIKTVSTQGPDAAKQFKFRYPPIDLEKKKLFIVLIDGSSPPFEIKRPK
ncbi:DUF4179 domain-containing protein [Paenibacillus sp. NPDC058071]|uniref:DUF4179 domain-containing protein n=1 Tax=Paenibacillus sp. NPDC058071 TaxID=3346326 RepID=UPI0036D78C36